MGLSSSSSVRFRLILFPTSILFLINTYVLHLTVLFVLIYLKLPIHSFDDTLFLFFLFLSRPFFFSPLVLTN